MIKNLKTNLGLIYVFKLITKNERGKKNLISSHECLMHRTRTNMYYKHETCLINVVSHFPSIFSASKQKKNKGRFHPNNKRNHKRAYTYCVNKNGEQKWQWRCEGLFFIARGREEREYNKCNDYNFTKPGAWSISRDLACLLICFFPSMILVPRSKTVLLLVDYRNYPFLINDLSFATVNSASIWHFCLNVADCVESNDLMDNDNLLYGER